MYVFQAGMVYVTSQQTNNFRGEIQVYVLYV